MLPSLAIFAGLTGPISSFEFPHKRIPRPSIFTVLHDHINVITAMYPQYAIQIWLSKPLVAHFTNNKYFYALDFMYPIKI